MTSSKRRRPRAGPHPHPVLGNPAQIDQSLGHQLGHALSEQAVEHRPVRYAKVRQRVCAHGDAAADPPVRIVLAAKPLERSRAAHPLRRRVDPQREQDPRIDRRPPCVPFHRLDPLVEHRQVQPFDELPHRPGSVVLREQTLQIRRSKLELRPVRTQYPRLLLHDLTPARHSITKRRRGEHFFSSSEPRSVRRPAICGERSDSTFGVALPEAIGRRSWPPFATSRVSRPRRSKP